MTGRRVGREQVMAELQRENHTDGVMKKLRRLARVHAASDRDEALSLASSVRDTLAFERLSRCRRGNQGFFAAIDAKCFRRRANSGPSTSFATASNLPEASRS